MSRLLHCCLCLRRNDMGAALSHPQEGEACDGAGVAAAPPTMADVIRERKKKAGGAGLGTLRRRIAAAARRPRDARPDRGCEHARFIRGVVSSWRLGEVFVLAEELEAGAALRDLVTQAELAREPAAALHADLANAYTHRWWCDVELVGAGWALAAHRAVLAARCTYFRDLLQRYPSGCTRVPLEGAAAALSLAEMQAALHALYAGHHAATTTTTTTTTTGSTRRRDRERERPLCDLCAKWERGGSDGALDIINGETGGTWRGPGSCGCGGGGGSGGGGGGGGGRADVGQLRRLGALLGFSLDTLHQDMRYLLDSGEYADARLVFRLEGGSGAAYGFRSALELPCHRLVLAARSRFFRSVMSRRAGSPGGSGAGAGGGGGGGGGGGAVGVCVDEKVLPRRFARALLHAAYTDQVDLSLIGRGPSSPSSSGGTAWAGVGVGRGAGAGRPGGAASAQLDDAFQLYEIARFLEMPIVVQGCEDAVVEALSADTLPHVLRWASAAHASPWVHRQAMRFLRDEFPCIMGSASGGRLPRSALEQALGSPFLQASEAQALRALLRWGERQAAADCLAIREPNVVWHTAHSVSRRGARRREVSDAALRETLASLLALVRTEHLPPDNDLLQQAVRRGLVPPPGAPEEGAADAWLGRGPHRPPRCFLPYLDEIKALLADQAVPEAEVARARRARYLQRIPDTLYMVAAARGGSSGAGASSVASGSLSCEGSCVSPRVLASLRARVRELRASPPAARALQLHAADKQQVHLQIALRAVREMSLPDACADLLLADADDAGSDRERSSGEWEPERHRPDRWPESDTDPKADCCRPLSAGGSLRCGSAGSARSAPAHHPHHPHHSSTEGGASLCRRELPARPADSAHRPSSGESACAARLRLSACVPDVAMAPNANTHLLTARDYFRHAPPELVGVGGAVLQLDLGDGATHTPRPGSRAQRAAAQGARMQRDRERDQAQAQALGCVRARPDDELRAAIELSVMRAYSSFQPSCSPPLALLGRGGTLPPRRDPPAPRSPPPADPPQGASRRPLLHTPPPLLAAGRRSGSAERGAMAGGMLSVPGERGDSPGGSPRAASPPHSPHSPRRGRHHYQHHIPQPHLPLPHQLYRHRDYRLEGNYSLSGSRGPSPSNYA